MAELHGVNFIDFEYLETFLHIIDQLLLVCSTPGLERHAASELVRIVVVYLVEVALVDVLHHVAKHVELDPLLFGEVLPQQQLLGELDYADVFVHIIVRCVDEHILERGRVFRLLVPHGDGLYDPADTGNVKRVDVVAVPALDLIVNEVL